MKQVQMTYYVKLKVDNTKALCDKADKIAAIQDKIKVELDKLGLEVSDIDFKINIIKDCQK